MASREDRRARALARRRKRLAKLTAPPALAVARATPASTGDKREGDLCSCGCGERLQRLPDGRLGVVTFTVMGAGGSGIRL